MSITEANHRNRLGRFILVSNLFLGVWIVILYLLRGFDTEEFGELLKILAPIKSVYLTAFIRYVVANRNATSSSSNSPTLNPLYANTSFSVIFAHISSLILVVTLQAFFNVFDDFDMMLNLVIGIETFFGVYVGLFMASMFKVEEDKKE